MGTRKSYWYSIIKYVADFTKGEPLNVGIFIEEENNKHTKYMLLENDNLKLKSIFESKLQSDVYKFGKDYFEYLLQMMSKNEYPTDNASDSFLQYLITGHDLPKGFILSQPQFAKTADFEKLFDSLATSYIGEKFLKNSNTARSLIIKERANNLFEKADLLHKKLKSNVRLAASPTLPFKYQIDYVYGVKDKIELIHTTPENIDALPDWFEKINVFSTKYSKTDKISLLYDSSVDSILLADTQSVIRTLSNSDNRINAIDLNETSNGINKLISDIASTGTSMKDLEKLIAS